jgi:hypothetical protein
MRRAVSNVIGYSILLGILFLAIAGLMLGGGAGTIETLQEQTQTEAGETGLIDLATATTAIASDSAQQRRVAIAPRSRGITKVATNSTLTLTVTSPAESPQTVYEADVGSIQYTGGDVTGRFEGGGVWMTTDGVGRRVIAPPIDYQQSSSGTATLSVTPVTLNEQPRQIGSRFRVRQSTSSTARYTPASNTNPITTGALRLTVTTTIPSMWEQYLKQTTPATVSTNGSAVTAVFTPPDTTPSPNGAIRLTGTEQTRIDTQDRLITGNSPDKPLYQERDVAQYQADVQTRGPVVATESATEVTILGSLSAPRMSTVREASVNTIDQTERAITSTKPSITGQLAAVARQFAAYDLRSTGQQQTGGTIDSGTTTIDSDTVITEPVTVTDDATLVISDETDGSRSPVRIDGPVSATDEATIIIETRDSNTTFAPTELHLSDNAQVVIRGDNHADIITSELTLADQSVYRFASGATATTGIYVHESVTLRDSTEIGAGRVFPNQVWLYVGESIKTRTTTQVSVTGVVYAPDADLTVHGDTRVDGAIIANSLDLRQSTLEVQYDVVLETKSPFTGREPPTGTLRIYATETPVTVDKN